MQDKKSTCDSLHLHLRICSPDPPWRLLQSRPAVVIEVAGLCDRSDCKSMGLCRKKKIIVDVCGREPPPRRSFACRRRWRSHSSRRHGYSCSWGCSLGRQPLTRSIASADPNPSIRKRNRQLRSPRRVGTMNLKCERGVDVDFRSVRKQNPRIKRVVSE